MARAAALISPMFEMEEDLYCSILPTATPYSRNALFSGKFPDAIAKEHPEWWETDEGSLNAFEDELFADQLSGSPARTFRCITRSIYGC